MPKSPLFKNIHGEHLKPGTMLGVDKKHPSLEKLTVELYIKTKSGPQSRSYSEFTRHSSFAVPNTK